MFLFTHAIRRVYPQPSGKLYEQSSVLHLVVHLLKQHHLHVVRACLEPSSSESQTNDNEDLLVAQDRDARAPGLLKAIVHKAGDTKVVPSGLVVDDLVASLGGKALADSRGVSGSTRVAVSRSAGGPTRTIESTSSN